jgi:uncharacterized protein YbjQ (UPF0145 family)
VTNDPQQQQWLDSLVAMPATTANEFPGWRITRNLGICFGVVARSAGFSRSFTAGFSAMRQGEVGEYTELMEHARHDAYMRLKGHAAQLGANAIVAVRFDSSEITAGITELFAYGTAVVVEASS